jgi:hypothetical protein
MDLLFLFRVAGIIARIANSDLKLNQCPGINRAYGRVGVLA